MKSKPAIKPIAGKQTPVVADAIADYANTQSAGHAAICRALRAAIAAAMPKATSKVWHGGPVWFIGENPVVGYDVTAKDGVKLLFWNGQAFDEPALKPCGKYGAAQVLFADASEIDAKKLRRWLKRARTDVFDSQGFFKKLRALRRKAGQ